LPSANIDRVKQQLQEHELTPKIGAAQTIVVPVSATKGTGIEELLENMVVQAEVMELKASPTATPRGTVIEAQVEAGRGPTANGHCANGHAQSGRALYLRRLRGQSEIAR
jgi:translation initiation factor IF-2